MKLNPKSKQLFDMLMQITPDYAAIRVALDSRHYLPEEVTAVALEFSELCFDESCDRDFEEANDPRYEYYMRPLGPIQREHSTHLYDVIKLLLEYGFGYRQDKHHGYDAVYCQ